jgi:hypothetical protein
MARGALGEVGTEADFASGMGIAIGAVIALFAVAILLFVLGQEQPRAAPVPRDATRGTTASTTLTPVAPAVTDRQ